MVLRPSFSDYYGRHDYRLLFRWIDRRKVAVARRAVRQLPAGALVVDLGCGTGRILSRLARPGDLAIAVDRDPRLLGIARGRRNVPVVADFNHSLPFADGIVDVLLMIDAIEHTDEPRRTLREIHRVLRPGGIAVLFTPPYDSMRWILAERIHHLITGRPSDHVSPCTAESLAWALEGCFPSFELGRINGNLTMYAIARKAGRPGADGMA